MSKPKLILLKTLEVPQEELNDEVLDYLDLLPAGFQFSMFDIIEHDEDTWFTKAIEDQEND